MLRKGQRVEDGGGGVALAQAIGWGGTAAGAVGSGVHHDDGVTGAQEEFRLTNDSDAVVGDAVEENDPTAVGVFRTDFPTSEKRSVLCANVEILARRSGEGEGGVGFANEVGSQHAANGMEERWGGEPSRHGRQERRGEEQNKSKAKEAGGEGGYLKVQQF